MKFGDLKEGERCMLKLVRNSFAVRKERIPVKLSNGRAWEHNARVLDDGSSVLVWEEEEVVKF